MIKTKMTVALSLLIGLFLMSASTAWAETCEADINCDGYVQFNDLKIMKDEYNRGYPGYDDCDPVCSEDISPICFMCYNSAECITYGCMDSCCCRSATYYPVGVCMSSGTCGGFGGSCVQ